MLQALGEPCGDFLSITSQFWMKKKHFIVSIRSTYQQLNEKQQYSQKKMYCHEFQFNRNLKAALMAT